MSRLYNSSSPIIKSLKLGKNQIIHGIGVTLLLLYLLSIFLLLLFIGCIGTDYGLLLFYKPGLISNSFLEFLSSVIFKCFLCYVLSEGFIDEYDWFEVYFFYVQNLIEVIPKFKASFKLLQSGSIHHNLFTIKLC